MLVGRCRLDARPTAAIVCSRPSRNFVIPPKQLPPPQLLVIHEIKIGVAAAASVAATSAADALVPVVNYVGISVAIIGLLLLLLPIMLENVEGIREGGQRRAWPWKGALLLLLLILPGHDTTQYVMVVRGAAQAKQLSESSDQRAR